MHRGSQTFVFVVFLAVAASFWATTISLYLEFADHSKPIQFNGELWFTLLTHYADLFLFFPLFGCVALIAFFTPASVFVDMYWNTSRQGDDPIPFSKQRFVLWMIVVIGVSVSLSYGMQNSTEKSLWQITPNVLTKDKGEGCAGKQCSGRVAFVDGLENVRKVSRQRLSVTDLERKCARDWFVAPVPGHPPARRFCAATSTFSEADGADLAKRWIDDQTCCRAQRRFDDAVKATYAQRNLANRSQTDELHVLLWPFNLFFLIVLLVLSLLLALRRARIEANYPEHARSIDRGVVIGVLAMAFLAVMHSAFLEATQLLHGQGETVSPHRSPETFIAIFTIWALLILFSFVHPANKQAELTSRFLGVVISVLFVFNADTVTNYGIRYLGAGAGMRSVAAIAIAAVLLVVLLAVLAYVRFMEDDDEEGSDVASAAGSGDDGRRQRVS